MVLCIFICSDNLVFYLVGCFFSFLGCSILLFCLERWKRREELESANITELSPNDDGFDWGEPQRRNEESTDEEHSEEEHSQLDNDDIELQLQQLQQSVTTSLDEEETELEMSQIDSRTRLTSSYDRNR